VGQAVDQAQQERELTKQALAADVDRLEARVRAELDWRARLRRDAPRYLALGAGAVLLVGAVVALRARLRKRPGNQPETAPASLDDVAAELREIRHRLERRETPPVWQRAVLRGVTSAAAAGGTLVARRVMERGSGTDEGSTGTHG